MARGATSKDKLFSDIQNLYPNSFWDGKILRVPFVEDGETVEIKVTLTAAKDVLGGASESVSVSEGSFPVVENNEPIEVTQEEKDNIKALMSELGL